MSYTIQNVTDKGSAAWIASNLIGELKEFEHLKDGEAVIAFLLDSVPQVRHGKSILGTAHMPDVQGRLRDVFRWSIEQTLGYSPDFIITLDQEYWDGADERMREILVFHELSHCVQKVDRDGEARFDEDGGPVWGLVSHDVEEFSATVRRYGAYSPEIREFIEAASAKVDPITEYYSDRAKSGLAALAT